MPASLSGRETEYLALAIMSLVGRRFIEGAAGQTQEELALTLHAEPEHVARVVEVLLFHGLLIEAGSTRTQLVPGIDLDSVELSRLWRLARAGATTLPPARAQLGKDIVELIDAAERAFEQHTGPLTLRQWLMRQ